MSNYHILTADEEGNAHQVVFHVPVPDVSNNAGMNYRSILSTLGGTTSIIPATVIDPAEQTQLDSGELYEVSRTFYSRPGDSEIQKRDALDLMFPVVVTETQTLLQNRLGYWGYERDVP